MDFLEFEVMRARPGDVLVFTLDAKTPLALAEKMRCLLEEHFEDTDIKSVVVIDIPVDVIRADPDDDL